MNSTVPTIRPAAVIGCVGIIVSAAGGTLILTVVYSALAVWVLGLAVPVTASYIIAAVMVAPALVASEVM